MQCHRARDGCPGSQAPGCPVNAGRDLIAQTAAEAFLAALARRGVEHLYVNAGTDFASIVEAYARRAESGLDMPTPVICPHENLAVGMAHGYALMTGRPQAVMVHVSVGTANCVCGLFNAARDQVPLILAAGRTPLYEQGRLGARNANIHWAQEMFDQAGMVREVVKWDYELHDALQTDLVVDRALAIAQADPRGPVYLTLPREVLAQELSGVEVFEASTALTSAAAPDPSAVEKLADLLARAQLPIVITSASGGTVEQVEAFADLVRRFGIGVVEYRARRLCLPASHPHHLGNDNRVALKEADLIVVLESDVPWMPSAQGGPREDARIVHIGVDPLFTRYPVRSFRSDLTMVASLAALLAPLKSALERRRSVGGFDPEPRARRIVEMAKSRRAELAARRNHIGAEPRIKRAWLNLCLSRALPEDAVLFNEYWIDRDIVDREQAGTYFGTPPAGGLGWGLPAALGACEAVPERVVVAAVGDGAYLFANPAACHQVAAAHGLPVLTIVCNNSQWAAVQWATLGVYPSGHAYQKGTPVPLSSLAPSAEFERYVEASGGYGERVTEAVQLPGALERALNVVRTERRQALLNVICD